MFCSHHGPIPTKKSHTDVFVVVVDFFTLFSRMQQTKEAPPLAVRRSSSSLLVLYVQHKSTSSKTGAVWSVLLQLAKAAFNNNK